MDGPLNTILSGDCIAKMAELPAASVDLAFADPPFNIGYEYDVYDDAVESQQYLAWSHEWIAKVHRLLKPNGTFWLAIGDEYAAELKLESQKIGFHCRSWVIWYYTFGVNCKYKFTRSHAHLFYFVKDANHFTFRSDDLDNRVPSARELVYNDKRANPKGRLPDDTWIIRPANAVGEMTADEDETWMPDLSPPADTDRTYTLRPQDLDECFTPAENTWYFPRVAGTFKERAGFHGCQMPEQLLGRIIRTCSNPGDVVFDPFSGSATTLAVAKKLGRGFLGCELSDDYVKYGLDRLSRIRAGDRLDGSPEPSKSAPRTADVSKHGTKTKNEKRPQHIAADRDRQAKEQRYDEIQMELTLRGVTAAFGETHNGFSADRLVADPELNAGFVAVCERLGLVGDARTWNGLLFRLRKAGQLAHLETAKRTTIAWQDCDEYFFAAEIALQRMLDAGDAGSIDEILCDPLLAEEFDQAAARLAPGFTPLEYRWAALRLRKEAKKARSRAAVLSPPRRFGEMIPVQDLKSKDLPKQPGLYLLSENRSRKLYVGETINLRRRLALQFGKEQLQEWSQIARSVFIQTRPLESAKTGNLAWQSCLVKKYKQRPRLNYFELRADGR
ncbi:MAG: site-specific DNA-methyltransferase [Planctomycetes bacterium]|nr:site-specific DNA-methyltransferase [Planctomycetota bacterium]